MAASMGNARVVRPVTHLDRLPNEILEKVLGFLPSFDLLSICEVNRRLNEICNCEKSKLLRRLDLHKCYAVTPHTLSVLRRRVDRTRIQTLNLSHCYWLTSAVLRRLNLDLPRLERLDLRGTPISLTMLMKVLSSAKSLSSLSFDHRWTMQPSDFSPEAWEIWTQLGEINVVLGQCVTASTFLSCKDLKGFSVGSILSTDKPCRCERHLLEHLRGRLDSLLVGQEVAVHHKWLHYTCRGGSRGVDDLCDKSFKSWSWCYHCANSPQILAVDATPAGSADFLQLPVSRRDVRHLYLRYRNGGRTQELLARLSSYTHLTTLNLCTSYPGSLPNPSWESYVHTLLQFLEDLAEQKTPLQHFSWNVVDCRHCHSIHAARTNPLARVLGKLMGLKTLSLPICSLSDACSSQSQPVWMTSSQLSTNPEAGLNYCSTSSGKRQRVGPKTNNYIRCESCLGETAERIQPRQDPVCVNCIYCGSNLARIVNGTPGLECLELFVPDCPSLLTIGRPVGYTPFTPCRVATFSAVSEETLLCISRWTNLRSLVLVGLPTLHRGNCLITIGQNCKQLRFLSLAHLGQRGQCRLLGNLCEALRHARHLEDLRFEHDNIDGLSTLFRTIECHQSIRRFCVISKNGSVNRNDVVRMITKCQQLVMFCLLCSMTVKDCKFLTQDVRARFRNSRPALRVAIGKYADFAKPNPSWASLREMPDTHIREVIAMSSQAGGKLHP